MEPNFLVVDNHPISRSGLHLIIREIVKTDGISSVPGLKEARQKLNGSKYHLMVVKCPRPGPQHVQQLCDIIHDFNQRVILISDLHWSENLSVLLENGMLGLFSNMSVTSELHRAFEIVMQQKPFFCPAFGRLIMHQLASKSVMHIDGIDITDRELQIIDLLAKGLTEREISNRLKIAFKTVGAHRGRIYSKLEIKSRVELVHFCYRHNLINL